MMVVKILWSMVFKRIMRYLNGTQDYGLWYKKGGNLELKVFTDVDCTRSIETKKTPVEKNSFLERS